MHNRATSGSMCITGATNNIMIIQKLSIALACLLILHPLAVLVFLCIPDTRDLHEGVGEMGGENSVSVSISDQGLAIFQICCMVLTILIDCWVIHVFTHLVHVARFDSNGYVLLEEDASAQAGNDDDDDDDDIGDNDFEFTSTHMLNFLRREPGAKQSVIVDTQKLYNLNLIQLVILVVQILTLAYPNTLRIVYLCILSGVTVVIAVLLFVIGLYTPVRVGIPGYCQLQTGFRDLNLDHLQYIHRGLFTARLGNGLHGEEGDFGPLFNLETDSEQLEELVKEHRPNHRDMQLLSVRDGIQTILTGTSKALVPVLLITLVLVITGFVYGFLRVVSTQTGPLSEDLLDEMNTATSYQTLFSGSSTLTRSHSTLNVHIVLVDGLRYDQLTKNSDLATWVSGISSDSFQAKMNAQLPSMSVPNWVSIMTAAPPEMTGVVGNLFVPETKYDSIFRQAKLFGVTRGLTGSPWFGEVVRQVLPYYAGANTIPTSDGANGATTALPADESRKSVALEAIAASTALWLTHFSNVDMQGHCCGVDKKWNADDTYQTAINSNTVQVEAIRAGISGSTVLVYLSDHGHMDRGGHGGTASVLTEVPVLFYKSGSGLAASTASYSGPYFSRSDGYSNLDVAATVTALMGLPAPRQSMGVFFEPVLAALLPSAAVRLQHYQDLARQKQTLATEFMNQISQSTSSDACFASSYTTEAECVAIVDGCMELIRDGRDTHLVETTVRNVLIALGLAIVIDLFCVSAIHRFTFAALDVVHSGLFSQQAWRDFGGFLRDYLTPSGCSGLGSTYMMSFEGKHRGTFFVAFMFVAVYYTACIVFFLVGYAIYGYYKFGSAEIWDSTYIHTPAVIPIYCFCVLATASGVLFILHKLSLSFASVWLEHTRDSDDSDTPAGCCTRLRRLLFECLYTFKSSSANERQDVLYLLHVYIVFWAIQAFLLLSVLFSPVVFVIPFVLRIWQITEGNWVYGFQTLTMLFLSMPLLIYVMVMILGSIKTGVNKSVHDNLFALKVWKDYVALRHLADQFVSREKREELQAVEAHELYYIRFVGDLLRGLIECLELSTKYRQGVKKVADRTNTPCCLPTSWAHSKERYTQNYWRHAHKEFVAIKAEFSTHVQAETDVHETPISPTSTPIQTKDDSAGAPSETPTQVDVDLAALTPVG